MAVDNKKTYWSRRNKAVREEQEASGLYYIICEPGFWEHKKWATGVVTITKPTNDEYITASSLKEAEEIRKQALLDSRIDYCEQQDDLNERLERG